MPQQLHERDISTNTRVQIDRSTDLCVLRDACHELFLRLWVFLCVRDAGCRGNKITVRSVLATRTTSWLYRLGTERKKKIKVKNDIKT